MMPSRFARSSDAGSLTCQPAFFQAFSKVMLSSAPANTFDDIVRVMARTISNTPIDLRPATPAVEVRTRRVGRSIA